jgi:Fic family protein
MVYGLQHLPDRQIRQREIGILADFASAGDPGADRSDRKKGLEREIERERILLGELPELLVQILELCRERGRIKIGEASKVTEISRSTIKDHAAALAENGHLVRHGAGNGAKSRQTLTRSLPIGISAPTYIPTAIPQLINEMFELLLTKAAAIRDPFEQSLFLMVQFPYLQPFVDVNKRTAAGRQYIARQKKQPGAAVVHRRIRVGQWQSR